eukprot:TRINITY_DN37452_c0_g1_i1.p1 TRINITY_DN37452_c0_g1~~TRINITY_DN37452_c0_g1_i1.p1  ORF type:complete len:315 (-),score=44.13 TRINITY_DN37452_c0_g1_i1:193-1137(-)
MASSAARRSAALAAHVYVSEGRDVGRISRIVAAGSTSGAVVVNTFVDAAYHRTGVTLAAFEACKLEAGVVAACREALRSLDLSAHRASHPRLGTVDHVACNPLGEATSEDAAALAEGIGRSLASGSSGDMDVSSVPVYLYGAARADRRPLADLRRSLGYFKGSDRSDWLGLSPETMQAVAIVPPDFGPSEVDPRHGVAVVGAVPWVVNYNLLVVAPFGQDGSPTFDEEELLKRCRRVARATSCRGGGLDAVEAMALAHERGVEIACNLLDVATTPAAKVRARVAELCASEEDLVLDSDYYTNKMPEEILEMLAS